MGTISDWGNGIKTNFDSTNYWSGFFGQLKDLPILCMKLTLALSIKIMSTTSPGYQEFSKATIAHFPHLQNSN